MGKHGLSGLEDFFLKTCRGVPFFSTKGVCIKPMGRNGHSGPSDAVGGGRCFGGGRSSTSFGLRENPLAPPESSLAPPEPPLAPPPRESESMCWETGESELSGRVSSL